MKLLFVFIILAAMFIAGCAPAVLNEPFVLGKNPKTADTGNNERVKDTSPLQYTITNDGSAANDDFEMPPLPDDSETDITLIPEDTNEEPLLPDDSDTDTPPPLE